jgi:hypothetical protein
MILGPNPRLGLILDVASVVGTGPEPRSETAIDRHSEAAPKRHSEVGVARRSPVAAAELGAKAGERATANLASAGEPGGGEPESMAGRLGTGEVAKGSGTS